MKNGLKSFAYYLIIPSFLTFFFNSLVKKNLILSNILFYLILLLFFFFCSRKEIWENFKDFKTNYKKYIPIILKWVLLCFILMVGANYIIGLFIENLPNNEINNRDLIQNSPLLSLIYLLFIAPLIEEFVFRFSFKEIKNYYGYTIFTSFLFATLHILSFTSLGELFYFIPYFILSFGFSNIYFRTKNYFASTLGHIIHNILCVIIILLF